jgi:D-arabinose 1-dehydrogenase-like Zn-dependent alcohol dehydrogenase
LAQVRPVNVPQLLRLLTLDGTLSVVGFPSPISLDIRNLTFGRKKLTSSGTGGRRGTAEMLGFATEHAITADIELLPSARVEEALTRSSEATSATASYWTCPTSTSLRLRRASALAFGGAGSVLTD